MIVSNFAAICKMQSVDVYSLIHTCGFRTETPRVLKYSKINLCLEFGPKKNIAGLIFLANSCCSRYVLFKPIAE